jgi:hypothetical protein
MNFKKSIVMRSTRYDGKLNYILRKKVNYKTPAKLMGEHIAVKAA